MNQLAIEIEGELFVIPMNNVKYLQVNPAPEKLPDTVYSQRCLKNIDDVEKADFLYWPLYAPFCTAGLNTAITIRVAIGQASAIKPNDENPKAPRKAPPKNAING